MDEITQKVVDGTAWREFCDMLRDAGDAILAEGNPTDPLDRVEGFRMLTRLLRGALEGKLEYGRPEVPALVCRGSGCPDSRLTAEHLYNSLIYAGFYVRGVADIGAGWARRQSQWPNVFTDEAEDDFTDKFKDPQIKWHQAYFELGDDEALVVDVTPPACEYWMITLQNHWMETLDYVHHRSTLNCSSAVMNDDGSVRFVIAHRDPGVPNWLDTAGHARGTVGVRWVGPDVVDVLPSTHVVPLTSLS